MRSETWRAALRVVAAAGAVLAGLAPLAPPATARAETVRDRQWFLRTLDVAAAHRLTTGAGVVVAVVDSGVADHPDLAGQVLPGTSFFGSGDGRADLDGHGTAMAGVIAARDAGADRILGIAPGAKVLPIKASAGDSNFAGGGEIGEGIRWAADHGAKVINVSVGGPRLPRETADAVRYAIDKDVVVVGAAGNQGEGGRRFDRPIEPARIPGVLAVGATGRDGRLLDLSLQGPEVALTAPGQDIPVPVPALMGKPVGYQYGASGTSLSAAIVSGAVALVRARFPQLRAQDVVQRLVATADDAGPPGRDPQYGFGRLNLVKALTADVPAATAHPLGLATPSATAAAPGAVPGRPAPPGGALLAAAAGCGGVLVLAVGGGTWLAVRRRRSAR
jgi:type VII secretion-associated serine protease mycosin